VQESAALPRDIAVFLPLFAIALHKMNAYPPDHPLRVSAVESAALRLQAALVNRDALILGVGKQQLVIEGIATDPDNPVLRELAQRLHRHQLGAVKFTHGVSREEFSDACQAICADSRQNPLGLAPRETLEKWENIRLFRPDYDRLELDEEGQGRTGGDGLPAQSNVNQLWLALAAAAVARQGGGEIVTDPQAIARALNQPGRSRDNDRMLVQYLLGLGRELRLAHGSEASILRERLTTLLTTVNGDALRQLLALGADLAQRKQLMRDAAQTLPANAVLTLIRAGADSASSMISQSMLRLLSKLSLQAERGRMSIREDADLVMREAMRQLVDRWNLTDPNPAVYTRVLERLARHPGRPAAAAADHPFEAMRIVQMSLETDTVGDLVWGALEEVVNDGRAAEVAALLDDERVAADIVEQFWLHLATPENMRILLNNEPRDTEVVERLLERMGMAAAEPMLETLEVADSRAMRRRLLTRLGHLGPGVGPMLVERLPGAPWYVARNLLALVGSLPTLPQGFDPAHYANHDDPRVRREVIKLMFRVPELRDEAVLTSLGDDDDHNVQLGLGAALEGCPSAAVPRLLILLNDRRLDPEIRASAIRVLGTIRTKATRDWLIERAVTRSRWFRRPRLIPKSRELLALLSSLARGFSADPAAQAVLKLAKESGDPDIRAAARETA
jgi:hypothetical protein